MEKAGKTEPDWVPLAIKSNLCLADMDWTVRSNIGVALIGSNLVKRVKLIVVIVKV
jgi:hypothetical protein